MEPILYKIALWTFFSGMIAHFVSLYPREGDKKGRTLMGLGVILIAAGFAALTGLISIRWVVQGRVPISSSYEYLSVLAWCVGVLYFIVMHKLRNLFIGACMSPALFLAVVFAGLYPMRLEMTLVPALQSYWLKIHVSMTIVGEAAFALAFVAGILYLVKNMRWKEIARGVKAKSFNLMLVSVASGLIVVFGLRGAGIVLVDLNGLNLFMGALGGALMVAMPVYVLLWRKLVNGNTGGLGGLIFALTVVAMILSGMGLASVKNRSRIKLDDLRYDIQALDQLGQESKRIGGTLNATAWQSFIEEREQDLATVFKLERLQAERKHSLTASEADEVMRGSGLAGKLQFPLSLGEIREQRQKLQLEVGHLHSMAELVGLPVTSQRLQNLRSGLINEYNQVFSSELIPPHEGSEAIFMGYMLLFGIPIFMLLYWLSPKLQSRIPELEALDSLAYRTVSLGFPIFTFGALIAGAIWAHYAWGKWWSNDPKEMGSLIVWLTFLIYLHARFVRRWSGNQAAVAAILGFLFAMLTFVGNSVLGGLHSYG
jgi:ABC-type transport system involved in cytochrome c biogenesis permease subunit